MQSSLVESPFYYSPLALEPDLADLVEIYYELANFFSAIVRIFGTKALDSVSNYEKHRNIDTAQQRFPDLKRRGCGPNTDGATALALRVGLGDDGEAARHHERSPDTFDGTRSDQPASGRRDGTTQRP